MSISLSGSDGVDQNTITGATALPAGTTAQRPASPVAGDLRFNTELETFEGYDGTAWGPAGGASVGAATGGTEVTSGGYKYHTFISTGALTVTKAGLFDLLIVGAGGAGGEGFYAGGGGGGQVALYQSAYLALGSHTVTIGAGGARGAALDSAGQVGSGTLIGSFFAGPGSGGKGRTNQTGAAGGINGSGGARYTPYNSQTPYTGAPNLGFDGGTTSANGGGGGAGAGEDGTSCASGVPGSGGDGVAHSTWASATSTGDSGYYGGGGGGGGDSATGGQGIGGQGGGGNGGNGTTAAATENGAANTGGGGGGGFAAGGNPTPNSGTGGSGGSGLVIVRYAV